MKGVKITVLTLVILSLISLSQQESACLSSLSPTVQEESPNTCFNLIAGKTFIAGTVCLSIDSNLRLVVSVNLYGTSFNQPNGFNSDFTMNGIYLWVGERDNLNSKPPTNDYSKYPYQAVNLGSIKSYTMKSVSSNRRISPFSIYYPQSCSKSSYNIAVYVDLRQKSSTTSKVITQGGVLSVCEQSNPNCINIGSWWGIAQV